MFIKNPSAMKLPFPITPPNHPLPCWKSDFVKIPHTLYEAPLPLLPISNILLEIPQKERSSYQVFLICSLWNFGQSQPLHSYKRRLTKVNFLHPNIARDTRGKCAAHYQKEVGCLPFHMLCQSRVDPLELEFSLLYYYNAVGQSLIPNLLLLMPDFRSIVSYLSALYVEMLTQCMCHSRHLTNLCENMIINGK